MINKIEYKIGQSYRDNPTIWGITAYIVKTHHTNKIIRRYFIWKKKILYFEGAGKITIIKVA